LVVDVAGLRALTDDELIRRHDAAVAQGGDVGARSTIYLDELRARVADHSVEAVMRRLLAILVVTGVTVVAAGRHDDSRALTGPRAISADAPWAS
jgi:hypothetical protein